MHSAYSLFPLAQAGLQLGNLISQVSTFWKDDLRGLAWVLSGDPGLSVWLHRGGKLYDCSIRAVCFHRHYLAQTVTHRLMLETGDRSDALLFIPPSTEPSTSYCQTPIEVPG